VEGTAVEGLMGYIMRSQWGNSPLAMDDSMNEGTIAIELVLKQERWRREKRQYDTNSEKLGYYCIRVRMGVRNATYKACNESTLKQFASLRNIIVTTSQLLCPSTL
jgi:hypothetical protein